MSGGHVVRHSPMHSNEKGTVINPHLRFPRLCSRIQTGSASWRSGINPVSLATALRTKDKALSHVPPLCSYITRITRILDSIALYGSNTRCTRVDLEITALREVDVIASRQTSSGYEARGKKGL